MNPRRFFFRSGDRPYSRVEIDAMIREHGPNILVGHHHHDDQSSLVYARSRGARIHWYMLGGGEPANGYGRDGRIRFPSDQKEIREHCREMRMSRAQWDEGGWLEWHKKKLLEARDEEKLAAHQRRVPSRVLPDTVEFDNLNNDKPERVAALIADFDQWRRQNGIKTQLVSKNLEEAQLAPIERRLKEGSITPSVFAPLHILEESASAAQVRIINGWAGARGHGVVQTTNTNHYVSPDRGFSLSATLAWLPEQGPALAAIRPFRVSPLSV